MCEQHICAFTPKMLLKGLLSISLVQRLSGNLSEIGEISLFNISALKVSYRAGYKCLKASFLLLLVSNEAHLKIWRKSKVISPNAFFQALIMYSQKFKYVYEFPSYQLCFSCLISLKKS